MSDTYSVIEDCFGDEAVIAKGLSLFEAECLLAREIQSCADDALCLEYYIMKD